LKPRSGLLFVTQFVYNKLYKLIKKHKTEEIHLKIIIIVLCSSLLQQWFKAY